MVAERITQIVGSAEFLDREVFLSDGAGETGAASRAYYLAELDRELARKEVRLPKSLRIHIRGLKAKGKWEEAMRVGMQAREQKRQMRREELIQTRLYRCIATLLRTQDSGIEATNELRAIWLLSAGGIITPKERREGIVEALGSKAPELQEYLEGKLPQIRDEVQLLMPPPARR